MKIYLLSFLCLSGITVSHAQKDGFVVKARINNPKNYTVVLGYSVNGKFQADTSSVMENGYYVFKGKVDEPVIALITIRNPGLSIKMKRGFIPAPSLNFFLVNDNIEINGNADAIELGSVSGGKPNEEWNKIRKEENQFRHESWVLSKHAYENTLTGGDSAELKNSYKISALNTRNTDELRDKFIADNPGSVVSLYFLANKIDMASPDDLELAYAKLDNEYKYTIFAKKIEAKINGMKATEIGKVAVQINKTDIKGNAVNLQSLKGKYVLLDFWGSWCAPCRRSHPHLKDLYARYKDKGFEIIGIAQETRESLEDNKKTWKEAITQDQLSWIQVLNNEDIEKFDAVKAYGITAFPTKILLGKEGKIVARYVGDGEAIDAKLKELFGF